MTLAAECTRCRDWGKYERHEDHASKPADVEGAY